MVSQVSEIFKEEKTIFEAKVFKLYQDNSSEKVMKSGQTSMLNITSPNMSAFSGIRGDFETRKETKAENFYSLNDLFANGSSWLDGKVFCLSCPFNKGKQDDDQQEVDIS